MSYPVATQVPYGVPQQQQPPPYVVSQTPAPAPTPVPQTPLPMYSQQPPMAGYQQPLPQQMAPQGFAQATQAAMQQQGYAPEKVQMVQQAIQAMPPQQQAQFQQQFVQQQQPAPMYPPQMMPPQQQQQPGFVTATNMPFAAPPAPGGFKVDPKDEKKTGSVKRFFGDTLVGRFARASVQTVTATAKMPSALSPWGDNNPVTLPNVRYRDAVLFTTFAFVGAPLIEGMDSAVSDIFGADSFVSEIVSSGAGTIVGSTVLKYGVFQIVEQAIDKGIIGKSAFLPLQL